MDTIAAISTPHGIGGIAVVRLSGPDAFAIASRHQKSPGAAHPQLFRIGEKVLDQVIATAYHAPHSYTAQITVGYKFGRKSKK